MNFNWSIKLDWQPIVFDTRLRRSELLKLQAHWPLQRIAIRVWRNLPFEYIAQAMAPFLAYAGFEAEFSYSDYDDTFAQHPMVDADLHIVAFDIGRYKAPFREHELDVWFANQLTALRAKTQKPVLVLNWASSSCNTTNHNIELQRNVDSLPDMHLLDIAALRDTTAWDFYDDRAQAVRATDWSDTAILHIARELALRFIPPTMGRMIKAVIVDFDDTLVKGVLGEDGIDGVQVIGWHRELQSLLQQYHAGGLLLGLASRNVASDVEDYFRLAKDSVLRREDFAAFEVSWDSKAESVRRIAKRFNIGLDTVLFIDDNVGQLGEVATAIPECHVLSATAETIAGVRYYPGMHKLQVSQEDKLRSADIKANQVRAELSQRSADPRDYLQSLGVALTFSCNDAATLQRIAELSGKTNQFNMALARLSESALTEIVGSGGAVVAVSMRDRLSDSGIIAGLVASPSASELVVHDLCISCRALGRGVATVMIAKALSMASQSLKPAVIRFNWVRGPRNAPALEWLSATAGAACSAASGTMTMVWDNAWLDRLRENLPVLIEEK